MAVWSTTKDVAGGLGGIAGAAGGAARSYMGTSIHQAGKKMVLDVYGLSRGMGAFGRVLGVGFMGFDAYMGYQQGGAWGAAKGLAHGAAINYAFGAGLQALGIGATAAAEVALPLTAVAGVGIYAFRRQLARPYVREHMRKHAKLEMGRPIIDQFGTTATMRQRSLMAMQNSKINGRSALGNEANLTYRPYFR